MPDQPSAVQRVVEAAASRGVQLNVVSFEESTHTAQEAAAAVGAELGQIVKSLVFVAPGPNGGEACLALVGGANSVDVPRLAACLRVAELRRASADEARQLTGFSIGGIPPFGHARQLRTVMDPDLLALRTVWAAAGRANAVFELAPATLRDLADALVAGIATTARQPADPAPRAECVEPAEPAGTAGAPSEA